MLTLFITSQNPQVEGTNQHQYIFNSEVSSPACASYLARYDSDSGLILLNASTAHGVTLCAEFTFCAPHDPHSFRKSLHTFIVNNSASFFSTLKPANNTPCHSLPTVFTVLQVTPGKGETIRLHLHADHNSTSLISAFHDIWHFPHNIEFVNSPDDAHLKLSIRDNQLVVSIKDMKATVYSFDHNFLIMKATPHDFTSFLQKVGSFYREHDCHTSIDTQLAKIITLEFYKLDATPSKFKDIPDSQLGALGPNLYSTEIIDFIVEEGCVYGVKLMNLSSHNLYPTLFYLDNSDLSIISGKTSHENLQQFAESMAIIPKYHQFY